MLYLDYMLYVIFNACIYICVNLILYYIILYHIILYYIIDSTLYIRLYIYIY